MSKNLNFGIVKNNQKTYISNESDVSNNNHIISVNVNIQNLPTNIVDFKKTHPNKYDIKPLNIKRNHPN